MLAHLLFSSGELRDWLSARWQKAQVAIDGRPEADFLVLDAAAWTEELADRISVEPIVFGDPEIEDLGETQVDVSQDRNRSIDDRGRPFYISGYRVAIHVPVRGGNTEILELTPSTFTYSPPQAVLASSDSVMRTLMIPDGRQPDIAPQAEALRRELDQWIGFGRPQIDEFNATLRTRIRAGIDARRQRILNRRGALASTGLPVRRRPDAPRTYQAPGVARRPSPAAPRSAAKPAAAPEPVLIDPFYEHILSVIRAGARGIERARNAFAGLKEEDLRQLFLFTLNTHYAGAATGEAFNAEGKTDILVRVEDRNVFIGECKFWSGAVGFSTTIDQLFGYTTWHDTKAALIMFVREKGLTEIIAKARTALGEHAQFKRWRDAPDGELRREMTWPGDADRTVDLSVQFVHLAVEEEGA
jgi:hypothetical protein